MYAYFFQLFHLIMASLPRKQHVLKLSTFLNDEFMVHLTLSRPKLRLYKTED